MSNNERMTGADAGVCAACVGVGAKHLDGCGGSEAVRVPSKAALLAEDEVQRLEQEGQK